MSNEIQTLGGVDYYEIGGMLFQTKIVDGAIRCAEAYAIPLTTDDFRVINGDLTLDGILVDAWLAKLAS